MTNLYENEKSFDINEEVLENVSGGTETSELSDFVIQDWTQEYGQADGSFKFVCKICGKIMTGTNLGHFFDEVNAHIRSHSSNINTDNIPLPVNPYDHLK